MAHATSLSLTLSHDILPSFSMYISLSHTLSTFTHAHTHTQTHTQFISIYTIFVIIVLSVACIINHIHKDSLSRYARCAYWLSAFKVDKNISRSYSSSYCRCSQSSGSISSTERLTPCTHGTLDIPVLS